MEQTDLNLPLAGDARVDGAILPAPLADLTAGIENSLVNLTIDEVVEMPFVKSNGGYLVGSLLQKRRFSAQALERLMIEKLWNPLYEVKMQEIEENLFLFGFEHQMDLKKVIREGPWRFNKHFLLLKEIPDPAKAVRSALTKIPIWVHVVDVPPTWLSVTAANAIGIKIGPVLEVDPDSAGVRGLGYLRVRVALEAATPIPRGISIGMGDSKKTVGFRYERLESYCFRCGYLDHIEDDCLEAYDPAKKGKIDWSGDYTALPPIRRYARQPRAAQAKGRVFDSVSPIGSYVKVAQDQGMDIVPYGSVFGVESGNEERPRKRTLAALAAPPGFEGKVVSSSKVEEGVGKNSGQVEEHARLME